VPGGNYREYIIAGILVQSLTFGMTGPATAIATDLTEGVIDRFRSLPVARSAYLSGHFVAEIGGMALSMFVLLASGLLVGWRVHNGLLPFLAAFALLVLFASVMVWVGTLIGLLVRTPDAVMGIAFTVVFPLTFLSNAFVPTETLPAGLRPIAEWNPVSTLVESVRELFGNNGAVTSESWPLQHATPVAFATCLVLLLVIVPQCLRRYRARTID
jgi:ABC transporter DrrB family efflux protein